MYEDLTLSLIDISWRWYCWICAILSGIIMILFVFLVPETRFERPSAAINALAIDDADIESNIAYDKETVTEGARAIEDVDKMVAPTPSLSTTQDRKKSYLQTLSLWSGRSKETGLFALFIRPFPLILYPTILWATLACKSENHFRARVSL